MTGSTGPVPAPTDGALRWARDSAWIGFGRAVTIGGTIAVAAVASRQLGADLYGVFTTVAVFVATGSLLLLGLPQATLREVSAASAVGDERAARVALGSGSAAILVLGAAVAVALAVGADLFAGLVETAPGTEGPLRMAIVVAGGALFLTAAGTTLDAALQGHRRFRAAALAGMLGVAVGWTALLVAFGTGCGIEVGLLALCIGPLCSMLLWAFVARGEGLPVLPVRSAERPCLARLLRTGLPIFVNDATFVVQSRLDSVFLLLLATDATAVVGRYNAAFQVALVATLPPRLMSTTFFPAVAHLSSVGEQRRIAPSLRRVTGFLVVAVVPIVAGGLVLRDAILGLVFPPDFAAARDVLAVLLPAYGVSAVMYPCTAALLGLGRPSVITANVVPMALAIVVLHLVLIPRLGMDGAALAAGLPIVVSALALPWQTARELRRVGSPVRASGLFPWGLLAKSAAASLVMAAGLVAIGPPASLARLGAWIAGGAAVYAFVFLVVLRGLDPEDRRLLRGLFGRG